MSRAVGLAALCALTTGCGATLKYAERWKPEAPLQASVLLEVVDQRPEDEGAKNPRQVGIVRGGYGNPAPFEVAEKTLVIETVRKALVDALHGAGVEASLKAPLTLKAKLTRFWMDGYVGYSAQVEVQLELVDAVGVTLWSQKVEGHEAGAVFSFGAASELLNTALAHLASDANARFKEEAFQRFLGGPK